MLYIIGMGLWDEKDISCRGLELARRADKVYVEFYTSKLMGSSLGKIEELLGRRVEEVGRGDLEEGCGRIIEEAREKDVAILVPGDPVIATTHVSLKLEAERRGVGVKIVHAGSIMSAVCALTGLQSYRFGISATVSYPHGDVVSRRPADVIRMNREIDAHTLLFLDLHPKPMTIGEAIEILGTVDPDLLKLFGVGIARAGSERPVVKCDKLEKLKGFHFGEPLHVLVVLAKTLHFMECECLKAFAGAPDEIEKLVK